jgi:hypothetical protein
VPECEFITANNPMPAYSLSNNNQRRKEYNKKEECKTTSKKGRNKGQEEEELKLMNAFDCNSFCMLH